MYIVVANHKAVTHRINSYREAMQVAKAYAMEHGISAQVVRSGNERWHEFLNVAEKVTQSVLEKQIGLAIEDINRLKDKQRTKAGHKALADAVAILKERLK